MIYAGNEGSDHYRTTMRAFVTFLCKHKQSRGLPLKTVSPAPTLGLLYKLNTDVCKNFFKNIS